MDELTHLLNEKSHLSYYTLRNYKNIYNKFITYGLPSNITNTSQEKIIEVINNLTNNPSIKLLYINIPIIIKKLHKNPVDLLEEYRTELKILSNKFYSDKSIKERNKLPDFNDIIKYTNELYDNKSYLKFIINYLLITYAFRNKDLDLFITYNTKINDISKNYLIIYSNYIKIIINNYKTLQSYGVKTFINKNSKFYKAVLNIRSESYLLTGKNTKLNHTSLNKAIQLRTYRKLGEAVYFKSLLQHLNNKSNKNKLIEYYSSTRGTSMETINKFYDITNDNITSHEIIED